MGTRDRRVDDYIARQAAFAQPILSHVRERVHAACPDVIEAIKWSSPFFIYNNQNLCHMAAFKAHAAFGFWHGGDVVAERKGDAPTAMGQFGRITSLGDLPDDGTLHALLSKAVALIDNGSRASRTSIKEPRAPLPIPPELMAAIRANPAAAKVWEGFAPGKIRDYAEWISEDKRPETRDKRIIQAVVWIAEGKDRNWKYR